MPVMLDARDAGSRLVFFLGVGDLHVDGLTRTEVVLSQPASVGRGVPVGCG
jgi:hypothetical protein